VNSAICVRAPDFVLDEWCERYGLMKTTRADLDPHYAAVGSFLGIAPTPDKVQGRRNLLFREGCDALGYSSEPISRNVRGCRGSGECFTGCRARAKQSMDISYVPAAVRAGCRVLTSARVERVIGSSDRAEGVRGRFVEPFTGRATRRFEVRARRVVLAAGCMATPVLLQKSGGLANRSRQVGRNLRFHPGVAISSVFNEDVDPHFGATQGYQSLQFLRDGYKLESLWAPAAVLAVRVPGFGHELKRRLADFRRSAIWDAIGSCNRSTGEVSARRRSFDPKLHWRLHPADVPILARALYTLCEIAFAAGAQTVATGVAGIPTEFHSLDDAQVMRSHSFRPGDFLTGGNHAFCHDVENLYIADTGVFPQCPSVNPMWTGMALAHRTAGVIAGSL
jgi:hypothetical protein